MASNFPSPPLQKQLQLQLQVPASNNSVEITTPGTSARRQAAGSTPGRRRGRFARGHCGEGGLEKQVSGGGGNTNSGKRRLHCGPSSLSLLSQQQDPQITQKIIHVETISNLSNLRNLSHLSSGSVIPVVNDYDDDYIDNDGTSTDTIATPPLLQQQRQHHHLHLPFISPSPSLSTSSFPSLSPSQSFSSYDHDSAAAAISPQLGKGEVMVEGTPKPMSPGVGVELSRLSRSIHSSSSNPSSSFESTRHSVKHGFIVNEIFTTERWYVGMLKKVRERFLIPLQKGPLLSNVTVRQIFSNFEQILGLNTELLDLMTSDGIANAFSRVGSVTHRCLIHSFF